MPSVVHAINDFVGAIFGIFISLGQSIFAVFHAIFALGADVVTSIVRVATHLLAMATELFSGVVGFVAGNFVAIALIVAAFFAYGQYQARNGRTTRSSYKSR